MKGIPMSNTDQNPRAVIGDNKAPNYAQQITKALERDYAESVDALAKLLDEARAAPAQVDDDEQMGVLARLVKRFRDTTSRLEAFRVAEKEPHFRAGQAVDGFFNSLIEKCARRDRKAKPGAADILQGRIDDYQQRKLAAEQERRRLEAEKAAREAREKAAAEEKARREAEEARLAAERARKPETKAEKASAAEQAQAAATAAISASAAAEAKAEDAYVETLARPADIVRTRVDEGPLVTMQQVGYAEIEDDTKLDMAKLWPFISIDAKEKALRAWAKSTGYRQQMAGAAIGHRNKSAVR
jgi:type II secretory ATPase GspE/PulE/Tfp pilus assembly ATPase PilB-like protein